MRLLRPLTACLLAGAIAASGHLLSAAEHSGLVLFAGAPVPGATVVVTQGDRRLATTTNRDGLYRFEDLDEGAWALRVEMRGFAPLTRAITIPGDEEVRDGLELAILSFDEIARTATAMAELPPGEEVATGPTLAQPPPPQAPARSGGAAPPPVAIGAPATPGIAPTATAQQPAAQTATLLEDEVPPNPLFGAADSFLVNGSVMNAAASPFAQSRAIRSSTATTPSRYVVRTSVGGRSSALDARPVGLTVRPNNHNVNFSATLGGSLRIPGLVRNGPQFTATFSRSDTHRASSSSLLLPTARERAGDFSQSVNAFGQPVQVVDPLTGQPFPGNVIPANRLSPEALALLAHYPAAGDADERRANFRGPSINTGRNDSVSFRLGGFPIRRQLNIEQITVGYSHGVSGSTTPFAFEDASRQSAANASVAVNRRLTPFILLQATSTIGVRMSRTVPHFAHRLNVSGLAGVTGNNQDPDNWGPPALTFRTLAPLQTADHASTRGLNSLSVGHVSWRHRRHALQVGGEVERRHVDVVAQQNPRGTFFFSGDQSGVDFADFLLGLPRTSTIAYGNADKYLRQSSYAVFFTDDVRVSPSFTMNLGLRWEYESPVIETRDRLVSLDVAPDFTAVTPVLASDPIGGLTGRRYPRSLVRPDRSGLQPRVAIAWRPFVGSSVVVRAGYGIYRNTNVYESIAMQMAQQPPLSVAASASHSDATPLTLANGFTATPTITQNTWAIDPDFRVGYAHNWQATIQRDFPGAIQMSGTYVGVRGSRLPQIFLPNTVAPGAGNPCPTCPSGFRYLTSGGTSYAHRGQIQVRRRLRNGLEASGQYTLATGADNASTFIGIGGTVAQNWRDLSAEHGPSATIRRHEFGSAFTYTSSAGAGRPGLRRALLGNWMLRSQISLSSGVPLTPIYSTAVPGTAEAATVRPRLTGAPVKGIEPGYYLNPAAFAPPAPGEWGDAGRGIIRGPGSFGLSATLNRQFTLNRRANMTVAVAASNLLNRVTHTGVNMLVGSPQFGLPTGYSQPRTLTMNLSTTFR